MTNKGSVFPMLGLDNSDDIKWPLVVDEDGRSALDIAQDPQSTRKELQQMVQQEHTISNRNHFTAWSLTEAVRNGDMAVVRRLVEAGAEIQTLEGPLSNTESAIRVAARDGRIDIVKYLLDEEQNRVSHFAYTPAKLELAMKSETHEEVEQLTKERDFLFRSSKNKNKALREAAGTGHLEIIQLLVKAGGEADVRADGQYDMTALEAASRGGHLDCVRYLLASGASPRPGGSCPSALKLASAGGFLEVICELLEAGARVEDDNALQAAAFSGHLEVVKRLLDAGAEIDAIYERPKSGAYKTALQEAARGGHVDMVEFLIREGANANAPPPHRGMNALQLAAACGSAKIVKNLIAAGADVNAPSYERTAIQAAAESGDMETVDTLLNAGAVLEKSVYMDGSYAAALQLAVEGRHLDVAEKLLDAISVQEPQEQRESYMRDPRTLALHTAAFAGHERLVRRLLETGTPIAELEGPRLLVSHTAFEGYTSIVKMLLDAGADMDGLSSRCSRTPFSKTALQSAVSGSHLETARLLLDYGADVNDAPARVKSPLHLACRKGDVHMVRLLLDAGADIYAVSYSGKTVHQSAGKGNNLEILQLLKDRELESRSTRSQTMVFDISHVAKKGLCTRCLDLPLETFTTGNSPPSYHQSLISLQQSALEGCPFCLFLLKQLGNNIATMPQSSKVRLHGGFDFASQGIMSIDIDEPYPKDVERPKRLHAGLHVCVEPFQGKPQPLPGNTHSSQTHEQIQSWLSRCSEGHPACTAKFGNSFLPSRLIDTTEWGSGKKLKLVEKRDIIEDHPLYMTLSHKWDEHIRASASTTTENLHSRLHSLNSQELPLTLIHAIEVTYQLGVKYLWIDCVCIAQDCQEDWNHESSLMSEVYRNAYCSIFAQVSGSSTAGLFRSESTMHDSVEFPCRSKDQQSRLVRAMKLQPRWSTLFDEGELQSRGWCLQQRELSTRIVHYTSSQVLWECRSFKASESWPARDATNERYPSPVAFSKRVLDNIKEVDDQAIYDMWYETIRDYTSRCLTRFEDTLPALGGLARAVNEHIRSDYMAGMWESDLPRTLAWTPYGTYSNDRRPKIRHATYIAPTWSWASLSGTVHFNKTKGVAHDSIGEHGTMITGYYIDLLTSDPFGQIRAAELHVKARIINGVLDYYRASDFHFLRDSIGKWFGHMQFDVKEESKSVKVVRCIYLFPEEHGRGLGLALVPVEGSESTYRRVGLISELDKNYFQDIDAEDITLI